MDFIKEDLLYAKLGELLTAYPHDVTLRTIRGRKEDISEKIKAILKFILDKKRFSVGESGLVTFVHDFGADAEALELEKRGRITPEILENILSRRAKEIELVECGEGERFIAYRIRFRKKGKPGVKWDYSDLVVKVMKDIAHKGTTKLDILKRFEMEHGLVLGAFGDNHVPDTSFRHSGKITNFTAEFGLNSGLCFQEFVNGLAINEACMDRFLAERLEKALPGFTKRYEEMMRTRRKVIDCLSTGKEDVLGRRRVDKRGKDHVQLCIIDTNNLYEVGSARYNKAFLNTDTGGNRYLEELRTLIARGVGRTIR
jgi:hypothetical protein